MVRKSRNQRWCILYVFSTIIESVAGVEGRLPKASIAYHFRRKGCVGDAALRGSDQGEPA